MESGAGKRLGTAGVGGKLKKRQVKSKEQAQTLFTQSAAFSGGNNLPPSSMQINEMEELQGAQLGALNGANLINKLMAQQPLSS